MQPVITVRSTAKSFGSNPVIDGCSFEVGAGESFGLVGLNGAGKTTLIRLLLGILRPDAGTITVLGSDPWRHDASVLRRIGVVLEHDGFWGNLTFEQNMRLFSAAKGIAWRDTAAYLEEHWKTTGIGNSAKPVKFFSRGQRMQCALCRAFLGAPALFIFDEPAVSLDVGAYDHLKSMVSDARRRGATFLISSHQLDAIDDLADRVGILREKRLTEISLTTGGSRRFWSVAADENPRAFHILQKLCGSAPVYNGGEWRFEVSDAATVIPEIVRELVRVGCSIRKVAPVENDFSARIRDEYRRTLPQGGGAGR
jgi:ABC-2 type transport system ATP-binding protein